METMQMEDIQQEILESQNPWKREIWNIYTEKKGNKISFPNSINCFFLNHDEDSYYWKSKHVN